MCCPLLGFMIVNLECKYQDGSTEFGIHDAVCGTDLTTKKAVHERGRK